MLIEIKDIEAYVEPDDIQSYCEKEELYPVYDFEAMVASLKMLNEDEKAKLMWFLIGIDDAITKTVIKRMIEVEVILPRIEDLLKVKKESQNV